MAQREKGGRVVFIGNIPYGVSEEQICEIFGRIGTVVGFRLVYDKETGRPKGFGFLEFTDVDAAASAVRNLNEFEIMGRTLRVDYSNDNGGGKGNTQQSHQNDGGDGAARAPPPAHFNMNNAQPPPQSMMPPDPSALPSLPPGVDLPAGVSAPDQISKTLSTLPPPQLLDILSQMKTLTAQNPAQASALLAQAPQLGYAIFQALLLLGLVDTSVLGSLIQQTANAPPPQQAVQQPQMPSMPGYPQQPPQQQQQQQPVYTAQQPPYGQPPPSAIPPQQYQPPPMAYAPTPPVQQAAYHPPPPQQPQVADPAAQALIAQLLAMPREQIMGLDEAQRNQILALRRQYGAPAF